MLGPAGELIEIESGKEYTCDDKNHLVFSLHCIKTNECDVEIETISGSKIIFPPGSFVAGAVYHIYLKRMTFNMDEAGFIGYKLYNKK